MSKYICVLLASILLSANAFAGQKLNWTLDVFRSLTGGAQAHVATLNYVSLKLDSGNIKDLGESILFLSDFNDISSGLHGHLMVNMIDGNKSEGKVILKVWDTSGLDASTQKYK